MKVYKVLYVMKTGELISNPMFRYSSLGDNPLKWSNQGRVPPGGSIIPGRWGIHWFIKLEEALVEYSTLSPGPWIDQIDHLVLFGCSVEGKCSIGAEHLRNQIGCSYQLKLITPLYEGTLDGDNVNWTRCGFTTLNDVFKVCNVLRRKNQKPLDKAKLDKPEKM